MIVGKKETDIGTIVTLGFMGVIVAAAGITGAILGNLSKVPPKQVYAMVKKIEEKGKKATLSDGTLLEISGNNLVVKMPYLGTHYTITDIGADGLKEELNGIAPDVADFKLTNYNESVEKALKEF